MELNFKKSFTIGITLLLLLLCSSIIASAQFVGIGPARHQSINGIHVFYSLDSKNEKWRLDLGTRIAVNIYQFNENKQYHFYYQTGYANNFGERFSLNLRPSIKLFEWKKFRFNWMQNTNVAYNSLKRKSQLQGQPVEIYWKPALVFEFTTGLLVDFKFSDKFTLSALAGSGWIYYNYRNDAGWDLTNNIAVYSFASPNAWNVERGYYEFVGLGDPPIIGLFLKYKL